MLSETLHVVTCVSNPMRYRSRMLLYEMFQERMAIAHVPLTTVELAYGDRPFECDYAYGEHVRLRLPSSDVLWHKENLLNIGIQSLPQDWKYVAWVDADVQFMNPRWLQETLQQLQLFDVVQMWSHAMDLDPEHQPAPDSRLATSFLYAYWNRLPDLSGGFYNTREWHPGYGWSCTRRAYESLGGLLDTAILGAGDRHMAMGLVGKADKSVPGNVTGGYKRSVMGWQELAQRHVQRRVSYVPGLITHGWHGRKAQRGYVNRWQVLVDNRYDPYTDIRRDWTKLGLIRWSSFDSVRLWNLRDDVIRYFSSRNEDSIDAE